MERRKVETASSLPCESEWLKPRGPERLARPIRLMLPPLLRIGAIVLRKNSWCSGFNVWDETSKFYILPQIAP
jgi:hypothetical protein